MSDMSLPILSAPPNAKADKYWLKKAPIEQSPTERYKYPPLGEGQIRLLRTSVEPKTGLVVCHFEHRDLESSLGSYRAISYCWGNPSPAYQILCSNGQSLVVTKSAAEILTHVIPRNPTGLYWIDQLCIHQKDKVERVAQVLLMGQIYSSPRQVTAWLGQGDKGSGKAIIDLLEVLFKEIEEMRRKGLQPTLKPLLSSPTSSRTIVSERRVGNQLDALGDFLKNPWFERVWVMQEVIMACAKSTSADPAVILCIGNRTIDFGVLAEVVKMLETENLLLDLFCDRPNDDGTIALGVEPAGLTAVRLFTRLRTDVSRKRPIWLTTGLNRAWDFKASNARDKLYAVRGFCNGVPETDFRLDYDADVEDVYKDWTAVLFKQLNLYPWQLHMAGIGLKRKYTRLPSWVPDYSSPSPWVQLRPETGKGTEGEYYCASDMHKKPEMVVDREAGSLRLQAIAIDTIEVTFRQPSMQQGSGLWHRNSNSLILNPDRKNYESPLAMVTRYIRVPRKLYPYI
ncbi:MAG: hypothetical protein Q9170_002559 [Blastenia crenularia]